MGIKAPRLSCETAIRVAIPIDTDTYSNAMQTQKGICASEEKLSESPTISESNIGGSGLPFEDGKSKYKSTTKF